MFARLLFIAASFAVTSLTALWYGAQVVGIVATMTTFATLLGIIANAGTSTSVIRYVSGMLAEGATEAARITYRRTMRICLIGATVIGIVFVALGTGWAERTFEGVAGMTTTFILFLAALAVPLRVYSEMTSLVIRALDSVMGFATLIILPGLVNLAVVGVGIMLGIGPEAAIWGFLAGLSVASVVGLMWITKRFNALPKSSSSATATAPSVTEILQFSFPMLLSTTGAYVVTASGVLLIASFGTASETGYFSVALRLATVSSLVLMSINAITTPIFARLYALGNIDELVSTARDTSRMMFWAVIPIILGLVVFGRSILSIAFGPEFEAAYVPMLLVLVGQLVNTATGPSDFLMNMSGMQRELRNIIVPAAVAAVALGLILVPLWGGVGAALTYGISMTCWNLASAILLRRRFGTWIAYLPFLTR